MAVAAVRLEEHQVAALGRHSYIGQLYDSRSGNLIAQNLWTENMTTIPLPASQTSISYQEDRTSGERTSSLEINASVSLSILGGAVTVSGYGHYLDRSSESESSLTIAAMSRIRTIRKELDPNVAARTPMLTTSQIQRSRATHVVTSITYGGTILGTFSQSTSQKEANSETEGDFSIELLKGFGALASAKGTASLDSAEAKHLNSLHIAFNLDGDFKSDQVNLTPAGIILLIETSGLLVGEGVPQELYMTPLSRYEDVSALKLARELAEADLLLLMNLYDRLRDHAQTCQTLSLAANRGSDGLQIPTLLKACNAESLSANTYLTRFKGDLGAFLARYRDKELGDISETAATFMEGGIKYLADHEGPLIVNQTKFESFLALKKSTSSHGYPLTNPSKIQLEMDGETEEQSVVVILIPEEAGTASILSAYRGLAKTLKDWRELDTSTKGKTEYVSFYTDPLADKDLLKLEGNTGTLKKALSMARDTKQPTLITFGYVKHLLDWRIFNQEGWGSIDDDVDKTRYVGEIRNGIPWGEGVMTYADGSVYTGTFALGLRNGRGQLQPGGPESNGVWVDNFLAWDHFIVSVSVLKNNKGIALDSIALRRRDTQRIQIARIAEIMGWKDEERFNLNMNYSGKELSTEFGPSSYSIIVQGSTIEGTLFDMEPRYLEGLHGDLDSFDIGVWGVFQDEKDGRDKGWSKIAKIAIIATVLKPSSAN